MANSASASKRIKQNERNRTRNRARKSMLKIEVRKFTEAVAAGDVQKAQGMLPALTKSIDQTAAKGTLHRKAAARRKSRLARRLNAVAKAVG